MLATYSFNIETYCYVCHGSVVMVTSVYICRPTAHLKYASTADSAVQAIVSLVLPDCQLAQTLPPYGLSMLTFWYTLADVWTIWEGEGLVR